jgi:hypothetical protein
VGSHVGCELRIGAVLEEFGDVGSGAHRPRLKCGRGQVYIWVGLGARDPT